MSKFYNPDLAFVHDTGHASIAAAAAEVVLGLLPDQGSHIVDLGCGSGILAEILVKAGHKVTGIDYSQAMIEIARKRVPDAEFFTGSFLDFEIPPCDAVVSTGEVLNYLFDPANDLHALKKLSEKVLLALKPDGFFLFDILEAKVPGEINNHQKISEQEEWTVFVSVTEDDKKKLLTREITLFRKQGELYHKSKEVHQQKLYNPLQIRAMLETAGFRISRFKSYGQLKLRERHSGFLAFKQDWFIKNVIQELSLAKNISYTLLSSETLKDWERSRVSRLHTISAGHEKKLILKEIKEHHTTGFNEYAGLKFLSSLESGNKVAPDFYYGNPEKSFFVAEDIESLTNIETYLTWNDKKAAENIFAKLAEKLAELTLITYGKKSVFDSIRQNFPYTSEYGIDTESRNFPESLDKLKKWFDTYEIKLSADFYHKLELVAVAYHNPAKFLSFSHGDMAPSNNLIKNGSVYLIDFEYCGYRHLLYDLTAWNTLCPLPPGIISMIKDTFFKQIKAALNISREEFEREWNLITVWRGIVMLGWLPFQIKQSNQKWTGDWTMRETFLSALQRIIAALEELPDFNPVQKPFIGLENILTENWGYAGKNLLPDWPVFR